MRIKMPEAGMVDVIRNPTKANPILKFFDSVVSNYYHGVWCRDAFLPAYFYGIFQRQANKLMNHRTSVERAFFNHGYSQNIPEHPDAMHFHFGALQFVRPVAGFQCRTSGNAVFGLQASQQRFKTSPLEPLLLQQPTTSNTTTLHFIWTLRLIGPICHTNASSWQCWSWYVTKTPKPASIWILVHQVATVQFQRTETNVHLYRFVLESGLIANKESFKWREIERWQSPNSTKKIYLYMYIYSNVAYFPM